MTHHCNFPWLTDTKSIAFEKTCNQGSWKNKNWWIAQLPNQSRTLSLIPGLLQGIADIVLLFQILFPEEGIRSIPWIPQLLPKTPSSGSTDFLTFIGKPKFYNRKINASLATIISSYKSAITKMPSKCKIGKILSRLRIEIGTFMSFVKSPGAEERPKHRQRNWYSFSLHWNLTYF